MDDGMVPSGLLLRATIVEGFSLQSPPPAPFGRPCYQRGSGDSWLRLAGAAGTASLTFILTALQTPSLLWRPCWRPPSRSGLAAIPAGALLGTVAVNHTQDYPAPVIPVLSSLSRPILMYLPSPHLMSAWRPGCLQALGLSACQPTHTGSPKQAHDQMPPGYCGLTQQPQGA